MNFYLAGLWLDLKYNLHEVNMSQTTLVWLCCYLFVFLLGENISLTVTQLTRVTLLCSGIKVFQHEHRRQRVINLSIPCLFCTTCIVLLIHWVQLNSHVVLVICLRDSCYCTCIHHGALKEVWCIFLTQCGWARNEEAMSSLRFAQYLNSLLIFFTVSMERCK